MLKLIFGIYIYLSTRHCSDSNFDTLEKLIHTNTYQGRYRKDIYLQRSNNNCLEGLGSEISNIFNYHLCPDLYIRTTDHDSQ